MQKLQILLFLLFISQVVFPTEYKPASKYTITSHLSNSEITALFIDSHQFLWIGTSDGLNRYDGYNFYRFFSETADSSTLPDDYILSINEDQLGNIWCATATSIAEYHQKDNTFTGIDLKNNIEAESALPSVIDMVLDKSGNKIYVLAGNFFGSIDLLNKQTVNFIEENKISEFRDFEFNSIEYNVKENKIILSNKNKIFICTPEKPIVQPIENLPEEMITADGGIKKVISGNDNNCYFCSAKHIWQLNFISNEIRKLNFPDEKNSKSLNINSISITNGNKLIIKTNNRIIEFQPGNQHTENIFDFNIDDKNRYTISSEIIDSSGILWVGTNKGLYKFNPYKNAFTNISLDDQTGIRKEDFITQESFINDENILLALNYNKLLIYKCNDKSFQRLKLKNSTAEVQINSINKDNSGKLLISTNEGLFLLKGYNSNIKDFSFEDKIFERKKIYAAAFDSDSIWVAGESGVFSCDLNLNRQIEKKSLSKIIAAIPVISIKCSEKFIWIQQNHRIIEYDKKTKSNYVITFPAYNNYKSPIINAILPYENSKLYVGTSDGLFIYSGDTKKLTSIDPSFRLANSYIHSLEKGKDDKIWISTNEGIVLFDVSTGKERLYNESDGLYINDYKRCLSGISPNGKLIFGGI